MEVFICANDTCENHVPVWLTDPRAPFVQTYLKNVPPTGATPGAFLAPKTSAVEHINPRNGRIVVRDVCRVLFRDGRGNEVMVCKACADANKFPKL